MRKTAFKNLPKLLLRRYRKFLLRKAQDQAVETTSQRRTWYGRNGAWRWFQRWRGDHGGA